MINDLGYVLMNAVSVTVTEDHVASDNFTGHFIITFEGYIENKKERPKCEVTYPLDHDHLEAYKIAMGAMAYHPDIILPQNKNAYMEELYREEIVFKEIPLKYKQTSIGKTIKVYRSSDYIITDFYNVPFINNKWYHTDGNGNKIWDYHHYYYLDKDELRIKFLIDPTSWEFKRNINYYLPYNRFEKKNKQAYSWIHGY